MLLDLYFLMAEGLRPKTSLTKQTGAVWRTLVAQLQEEALLTTEREKSPDAKYVPKYRIVRQKQPRPTPKVATAKNLTATPVAPVENKPAIIRWERVDFLTLMQYYGVLRLSVVRQAEQDDEDELIMLLLH